MRFHPAVLFTLLSCVLAGYSHAADRPTADEVAAAVERSRAEFVEKNPPLTQDQKAELIRKQIAELERINSQRLSRKLASPEQQREFAKEQQAKIAERKKQISELRKELAQVLRSYKPVPTEPRLMPIDLDELSVGAVGRWGSGEARFFVVGKGETSGEVIRCIQILGKDEALVQFEWQTQSIAGVSRGGTARRGPYLLRGFDTGKMQEDRTFEAEFDLVVSDQYQYTDTLGTMRTVFVVEVFDPDKPFPAGS